MSFARARRRIVLMTAGIAVVVAGALGVAAAATMHTPDSNAYAAGRGINEFGMTHAYFQGHAVNFTYSRGFVCDKSVSAASTSKCEAGAKWKHAPNTQHDPLYITVPLGFARPNNMLDCPQKVICVDHPGTIDMSRLEPALKPLYPKLTDAQLTGALKSFQVPGHDHFITDLNGGKREYWDVYVVGVTSPKTYDSIIAHKSFGYIRSLLKAKDKTVVGPIPTNLFLFFGVH